jgi:hypothetical protein
MAPAVKTTQEAIVTRSKGAVPIAIREHFFGKFVTHGKHGGIGPGA